MSKSHINTKMFGRKIREARENKNFTQAYIAEQIGISQNFLGDIERGIKLPSLNTLIRLSNVLKLSLDTMFADSLENTLYEPDEIYYTDKQLSLMKGVIKTITDNFKD
ncbi:MAG: helix-turn-helix transcriptional regulator [Clostridia bacterium]